jgi:hypothetical protein
MTAPAPATHLRVWRGWRLDALKRERFEEHLSATFIPATAQLMAQFGLQCYIPGLPRPVPEPGSPDAVTDPVPDEVALLFYRSRRDYDAARDTVAGRTYSLLHEAAFRFGTPTPGAPTSSSDVAAHPDRPEDEPSRTIWRPPPDAGAPALEDPGSVVVFAVLRLKPPRVLHDPARLLRLLADASDELGKSAESGEITAVGEAVALPERQHILLWLAVRKASSPSPPPADSTEWAQRRVSPEERLLKRIALELGATLADWQIATDLTAPPPFSAAHPTPSGAVQIPGAGGGKDQPASRVWRYAGLRPGPL